jgi:hypothetical protein
MDQSIGAADARVPDQPKKTSPFHP